MPALAQSRLESAPNQRSDGHPRCGDDPAKAMVETGRSLRPCLRSGRVHAWQFASAALGARNPPRLGLGILAPVARLCDGLAFAWIEPVDPAAVSGTVLVGLSTGAKAAAFGKCCSRVCSLRGC